MSVKRGGRRGFHNRSSLSEKAGAVLAHEGAALFGVHHGLGRSSHSLTLSSLSAFLNAPLT